MKAPADSLEQRETGPEGTRSAAAEDHPLTRLLPAQESWLRTYLRRAGARGASLDDALQETFARAWRSRHRFEADRPLKPWLRATALRAWIDLRRRDARQPQGDDRHEPLDARPEPAAEVDPRLDLAAAMQSVLPATERLVFERFHLEGEAIRDIAEALGMPENTVKSHLHRARRRLAPVLDPVTPTDTPEAAP